MKLELLHFKESKEAEPFDLIAEFTVKEIKEIAELLGVDAKDALKFVLERSKN